MTKLYETDRLMWLLGKHMCNDFQSSCDTKVWDPFFHAPDIHRCRSIAWPSKMRLSAMVFKRQYQLENIYKRYRFRSDLYTDAELEETTFKTFVATQVRIGTAKQLRTPLTHRVLQLARLKAKAILGPYCEESHIDRCKFGSKSTVGNSLRDSYLDLKVPVDGKITGSRAHGAWFSRYADGKLLSYLNDDFLIPCVSLPLVCVPKSFKAFRSIMPNTTLGGFYTYGLGKYIEDRLKLVGLNISTLQQKHRRLAKAFSKDRSHATADLSAASDSFRSELVNMILPREWYRAAKLGRIDHFTYGERTLYLSSFMTMGIGFTFPLQTLIFYCLLSAIQDLSSLKGIVSVYGDDLIYPSRMHKYVVKVFNTLDFQLNIDKTYVKDPFRESCGSDCFRGVDVRPFQPEGGSQALGPLQYLSYIYKIANGMLLRWDKEEIPQTLRFLLLEAMRVTDSIHIVPKHYPDGAGFKTSSPYEIISPFVEQSTVEFDRSGWLGYKFRALLPRVQKHVTTRQWIYLWDTLRSSSVAESVALQAHSSGVTIAPEPTLRWMKHRDRTRVKSVRWGDRGWRIFTRVLVPYQPRRCSVPSVKDQLGTTSSWTVEATI